MPIRHDVFRAIASWRAVVAIVLSTLNGSVASETVASHERWWSGETEVALAQAGTNRSELEHALQLAPVAQRVGLEFLLTNMPLHDLTSLPAGLLSENVSLAYFAWEKAPWRSRITTDLFLNDVLPYASVSEPRENWRAKLRDLAASLVADCSSPSEAAHRLNQRLFKQLGVRYSTKRRATDQGPLETIASGIATCTGLSILLVDACRAVGVPARVVGTPMWVNNTGNHTWVEIWDGDWHFLGAAEPNPNGLDHGWFTRDASQALASDPAHAIYASSFRKTGLKFPLSWAAEVNYVNALNVTARYTGCAPRANRNKMLLRISVLDRPLGERVAAKLTVTDSADALVHFEDTSKTEPADINDRLTFTLPMRRTYLVEATHDGLRNRRFYSPGTNTEDLLTIHLRGVPAVNAPVPMQCAPAVATKPLPAKTIAQLKSAAAGFFAATSAEQAAWKFSANLEAALARNELAVRRAVWAAFQASPVHTELRKALTEHQVRSGEQVSPYTVKTVGVRPESGWALFIALHGGGGAPQELNDSQWVKMQSYYRDHPEVGGYCYVALRAPNNQWNGFYTDYVYPLIARLIEQFVLFADVDPDKVFLMGYSHGGYGAFAIGPKMADRFAAIHSSAAAPADGTEPQTLRNTVLTCMVGELDTAHGRIERCRRFESEVKALRGGRTDIFPVTVSVIAKHPHSGLPDREKIAEMYPAVRNSVPRELTWRMTDGVISDFFWLHTAKPVKGHDFNATCRDNVVTVNAPQLDAGTVLLDSRLVDFARPVTLEVNGKRTTHGLTPSLRTLCETIQRRGDPALAFTVRLVLTTQEETPAK
jgi:transglutaminase-like putative cysteine protease/pimeloyl-ACP methyl ester carboxylesterase